MQCETCTVTETGHSTQLCSNVILKIRGNITIDTKYVFIPIPFKTFRFFSINFE